MSSDRSSVAVLLDRAVRAGIVPSAVALWGRVGEEPRLEVAGRVSLARTGTAPTPGTWYDLASITKPFVVGTLALLAFRRGSMALDATVGALFGRSPSESPLAAATVSQLLSHASGLPAWRPLYAVHDDPDRVVDTLFGVDLASMPGRRLEYSCLGFILLGKAIERIHGQPLDVVFSKTVLEPLGLTDELGFAPDPGRRALAGQSTTVAPEERMTAELGLDPTRVPALAPGLPHDGNARFLGGVAGNAGLFGSAVGVFRLASEYLARHRGLLRAVEIDTATSVVASDVQQVRGLGWQLASTPSCSAGRGLGSGAFGHVGFTGTSVWVDPDQDGVFVLLTNRCHPDFREMDLHPLRRRFHALAAADLAS